MDNEYHIKYTKGVPGKILGKIAGDFAQHTMTYK